MKKFYSFLLFSIFLAGVPQLSVAQKSDAKATTKKFEALFNYIEKLYVDSIDGEQLVETAIEAMLEELDPHSIYIPKDEMEALNAPLKGNFEGIGVRFDILKDTIIVVNPIPSGPSEKLGIRAGDKIITIEGDTVAGIGIKNSGVRERLLGKKGSKVEVEILRKSERDLLEFEITRDRIPIVSIEASYMVNSKVGYIKLNNFGAQTMKEFHAAMDELQLEGMESLILDLQGNGGGYLKTAIQLADEFLDEEKLIVYTKGRKSKVDYTYAEKVGKFETGKLVVMIDEGSASASEIVSGAVQDWDRGMLVGRRSFGKGLVQKPVRLPDGSGARITISRYYTPSGRCIQKPYDEGAEAYRKEKNERFANGEVYEELQADVEDSLKYETKLLNRTVFGGGGITPDFFVAIDTSETTPYYRKLWRKGIIGDYCLTYVTEHRDVLLSKYKNVKKFKRKFKINKKIKEEFLAYADEEGVPFKEKEYQTSEQLIEYRLRAQIAQDLWGLEAFYYIINDINDSYQKALEILKDDTFKKMNLAQASQ